MKRVLCPSRSTLMTEKPLTFSRLLWVSVTWSRKHLKEQELFKGSCYRKRRSKRTCAISTAILQLQKYILIKWFSTCGLGPPEGASVWDGGLTWKTELYRFVVWFPVFSLRISGPRIYKVQSTSYFLRCLKRTCMVSWLALGSCLTRSLMDWTLCLYSDISAQHKPKETQRPSFQNQLFCSKTLKYLDFF